jgi:tetratricopeptide (TPR) repeat protein
MIQFSEDDILKKVGERSFERGRRYFQESAIFNARRQGATLKAYCEGSRPEPYSVRVTFGSEGIGEANCSCPVGEGGYCKHVAALLLTWLHRPEEFREVEELDKALEQRSKAELIALIKQMLLRCPELEVLLETPLPGSKRRGRGVVDPETYRRQAAAAFHYGRDCWGVEAHIAQELEAIVAIGDGFAAQEDWASAAAVYQAVSAEVLANYEMFHDEEGRLGSVVQACVEGLGRCLSGVGEENREGVLKALFEVYRFDVDFGGAGLGDEVPGIVLKQSTVEERRKVAGWVRAAIPKGGNWSTDWQRRVLGGFLLKLEGDIDDEKFLDICRETGRLGDLVDRLLTLGRLEEAEAEARKANDYELLQIAGILVGHGHGKVAERLMVERSKTTKDLRILEWLESHYTATNKPAEALSLAQRLFKLQPRLSYYQRIRELAGQLGKWAKLRQELLQMISGKEWGLLIDIYLDEGEIEVALEVLKHNQANIQALGASYLIKVARAAEKPHPREAIKLYQQMAEGLIAARGRENYREACGYLRRIRGLYQRLREGEVWASYIAELRERNRNLPALKDELTVAGL